MGKQERSQTENGKGNGLTGMVLGESQEGHIPVSELPPDPATFWQCHLWVFNGLACSYEESSHHGFNFTNTNILTEVL